MMPSAIDDDMSIDESCRDLCSSKIEVLAQTESHTLLIVDDDPVNRIVLKSMLLREGYNVIVAENAKQAVELFRNTCPDLVLMDLMAPEMDGYDVAEIIKCESRDQYIPIMFLTAIRDEDALAKSIEAGGNDFLSKPYSPVILKARIESLLSTRALHLATRKQNELLSLREEEIAIDLDIAERILSKISEDEAFDVSNINYHLSPMEQLNGDIITVAHKPDGGQIYLLGDFTGHGLGAAIGGLVVFDVFKAMSAKGFSLIQIISEINRKLREVLPTGRFLAAGLVELDAEHTVASVWNGGLPDIYLRGNQGGITAVFPSTHLPLGVLGTHDLDLKTATVRIHKDDRFILYSDGLIEGENQDGELFGRERLEKCINSIEDPETLFSNIHKCIDDFCENCPQRDDLSILEIICDPERVNPEERKLKMQAALPAAKWSLDFKVYADLIKEADIIPSLVQMIVDIQGLYHFQKPLYLIMTELYSNALEHGLLDINPEIRSTPDGFEQYYMNRKQALAELDKGSILFSLKHEPCSKGGKLTLRLSHDGDGFDVESTMSLVNTPEESMKNMRGIKLVKSLTERLEYEDFGKSVEIDYIWEQE